MVITKIGDEFLLNAGHDCWEEMIRAGAEILLDEIGDNAMARQIVFDIFVAMRKVELRQPSDD